MRDPVDVPVARLPREFEVRGDDLPATLRAIRGVDGVSYGALARAVGVHKTTMIQSLQGTRRLTFERASDIAGKLGFDLLVVIRKRDAPGADT